MNQREFGQLTRYANIRGMKRQVIIEFMDFTPEMPAYLCNSYR